MVTKVQLLWKRYGRLIENRQAEIENLVIPKDFATSPGD